MPQVMYCPVCGVEYRSGFVQCSDCLVALVPERPRRTRESVTVLEGDDPGMIASAERLFRESGIPFQVRNEDDEGTCRLEVPTGCEQEALALLQSMETGEPGDEEPEQQPLEPDPDLELVTVLESDSPPTIALAKSALQRAGIPFYVRGEEIGLRMIPYGSFLKPWCRIQVAADVQSRARELVRPFESDSAGE